MYIYIYIHQGDRPNFRSSRSHGEARDTQLSEGETDAHHDHQKPNDASDNGKLFSARSLRWKPLPTHQRSATHVRSGSNAHRNRLHHDLELIKRHVLIVVGVGAIHEHPCLVLRELLIATVAEEV